MKDLLIRHDKIQNRLIKIVYEYSALPIAAQ